MKKNNNLGKFGSLNAVWNSYPYGGKEGDYLTIGSTEYYWNKYVENWRAEVIDPDHQSSIARKQTTIDGDLNVQNNLTVAGTIRAKGLKQPNCGLFESEESLKESYPNPEVGMWATVGDTIPTKVYRCSKTGVWEATGETGGIDALDWEKQEKFEQKINDVIADIIRDEVLMSSKNMYDSEMSEDGWLSAVSGIVNENEAGQSYKTSGYISVEEGKQYTFSINGKSDEVKIRRVCYYDTKKEFISSEDYSESNPLSTITAVEGASYVRFTPMTPTEGENFQMEEGAVATDYEAYAKGYKVTTKKLLDNSVSIEKIGDERLKKIAGSVVDRHQYNEAEEYPAYKEYECKLDKGTIITEIDVEESQQIIVYKESRQPSGEGAYRLGASDVPFELPIGVNYIRSSSAKPFGIKTTSNTISLALEEGSVTWGNLSEEAKSKIRYRTESKEGGMYVRGDLSNGTTLSLDSNSVKTFKRISLSGDLVSKSGSIVIGHGDETSYFGSWVEIDTSNVTTRYSVLSTDLHPQTRAHGLKLDGKKLYVEIKKDLHPSYANISIGTENESVTLTMRWYGDNGSVYVKSSGMELKNCSLGWSCAKLGSKVWLMGDSYLSLGDEKRWPYYLLKEYYSDLLINAYPGEKATRIYSDFVNLLKIGKPEVVVFAGGMNDKDNSSGGTTAETPHGDWLRYTKKLLQICDDYGIKAYLCTIPTVYGGKASADDSGISGFRYHGAKNAWIKSSGYPYIDFAKAVGASDETGLWYGEGTSEHMLEGEKETDVRVHPTKYGAVALYRQAISDCPALMGEVGMESYDDSIKQLGTDIKSVENRLGVVEGKTYVDTIGGKKGNITLEGGNKEAGKVNFEISEDGKISASVVDGEYARRDDVENTYLKETVASNIYEDKTTAKKNYDELKGDIKDIYKAISDESDARRNADATLTNRVTITETTLKAEAETRQSQVSELSQSISAINVDLTGKQNQIDTLNSGKASKTEVSAVKTTAEKALKIAKGANQAVAFDTYEEMFMFLEQGASAWETKYGAEARTGQNIYIGTLSVPDVWISNIGSGLGYSYTSDEQTAKDLVSETGIVTAWCTLRALETQKVDLSEVQDKLTSDVKATATVGKVTSGSVFSEGTAVRDIVVAMLSFETPSFASLAVSDGTTTYSASKNIFCSGTPISFKTISHSETNVDSIKGRQIKLNINGTEITKGASSSVVSVARTDTFNIATNKATYRVTASGTNTLNAPMTSRSVVITAYMPVYTYVCDTHDEATITGALASAVAKQTIYIGDNTINENLSFKAGGCWCVALPSHLDANGIGTPDDFQFGYQFSQQISYTARRSVNGIADVDYVVHVWVCDTAQEKIDVQFRTKNKTN